MDNKQMKIAAVAAVLVIVVAAVAVYFVTKDKGGDDPEDTYYFYFDGFDAKDNGWQSAQNNDMVKAFAEAVKATGLDLEMSEKGWISSEKYPSTYDKETLSGMGMGIYGYNSKDNTQPNAQYFFTGPVATEVTSNIIYISYGKYSFDADYNTTYEVNPATSDAWKTGGPFAVGADYKPLSFGDKYYFYLDGMGDKNGWYSAEADNIVDAFKAAVKDTGLTITISDKGWLSIVECPATYDKETQTGKGLGLFGYASQDNTQPNAQYFFSGPVMSNVTSNILYITYSDYSFDASYNTIYKVNPTTSDAWSTSGPFAQS